MEFLFAEHISLSLETLGTVFIAFAALRVHHRVLHEHRIDDQVFKEMKLERKVGIVGMSFVLLGYFINIYSIFF